MENLEQLPESNVDNNKLIGQERNRKKRMEYDKARRAKIDFMKKLGREAADLAWDKTEIAGREKGLELLTPQKFLSIDTEPEDSREKTRRFWAKQAFDNFFQPILDYENLKKDIEKELPSKTKKKEALRELEARKRAVEARLAQLPDWNSGASEEEKREYVGRLEKLLDYARF